MALTMGMSDYSAHLSLNKLLRNVDYTSPMDVYLALFADSSGLRLNDNLLWTEVSGVNYARQPVVFVAPVNFQVTNSALVAFVAAGAGGWGTVAYAAAMDALTPPGNVLYWGPMNPQKTIGEGEPVEFPTGEILLTLGKTVGS